MYQHSKNKKGATLVMFALSLIVLLGMAGIALDVTHLYNVKNQLQLAADAAALAGANELQGTDAAQMIANAKEAAYLVGSQEGSQNMADGEPVSINKETDVEVGNWNSITNTFTPYSGGIPNAVRVTARRLGAVNWFMRVMSIWGEDFANADVRSVAIACRQKLSLVPLVVNEYWDEVPGPGKPYGQTYPHSFMREINVDGTLSLMAGRPFAITGSRANNNPIPPAVSQNPNGYVDLLLRNSKYSGDGEWYQFDENTGKGDCTDCPKTSLGYTPNGEDIAPLKFGEYFYYLFGDTPGHKMDSIVPPIPVERTTTAPYGEPYNPNYPVGQASYYPPITPPPPPDYTSDCPFATVAYFIHGGTITIQPQGPLNLRFYERWPKGQRFLLMVYDGIISTSGSAPNVVTVVGYGVIEIDGYLTPHFNGYPSTLNVKGNTCYGHVRPHELQGEPDKYLIQRLPGETCEQFMEKLETVQRKFAPAVLVDPTLNYGVASHTY